MAGIGFQLNKLAQKDNLWGVASAYGHSMMASSGPWLFTVLALVIITFLYSGDIVNYDMMNFRGIIVYNFSISLVTSSIVFMIITRYLADYIHVKDVTSTPTVMLQGLFQVFALTLLPALFLYTYYLELPLALRMLGFANIFLIGGVWLLGVFLTALKDYNAVSKAFLIGMIIAIIGAYVLDDAYDATGMLWGFNIGLAVIFFMLVARVFAEYPYRIRHDAGLWAFYKKYSALAWGGVFYNLGIWIDKWIMWYVPIEATVLPSNLHFYPTYDSAMFLAYLTIVPSLALFIFSVETNFFLHYRRFYGNILSHAPLKRVKSYHTNIIESLYEGARNMIFLQGVICFVAILLAPQIFWLLDIQFLQISIFRYGVLGAFFHTMMLFTSIILSYFDRRKTIMLIYGLFMVLNALCTLITIELGFEYYGYGYFIAALVSFAVSAIVLFHHVRKLPYHAFITSNISITRAKHKFAKGSSEPTMNVAH